MKNIGNTVWKKVFGKRKEIDDLARLIYASLDILLKSVMRNINQIKRAGLSLQLQYNKSVAR